MKAALISLGSTASQKILAAMDDVFDKVENLQLANIEVSLGGKKAEILYEGQPLPFYDCVYARGSARHNTLLRAIATIYKDSYQPISANAFTLGRDKLLTHLALQAANIPQPKTYIATTAEAGKKILKKVSYPIILKLPSGTHGKGVMLADSHESASSMIDALAILKQPFIMQEYIETDGTDIRALVVGDHVVAAMRRTAGKGEKRANIHAGGKGTPIILDAKTRKLAITAAHAIGCSIAGVDILPGPKGPVVLEINLSPGMHISSVTGIDVPKAIATYLSEQTKAFRKRYEVEAMQEISPEKEIVTKLDFRGERILLPEVITKLSQLTHDEDVIIKATRKKLSIEKE